jgi:hypothetical protein
MRDWARWGLLKPLCTHLIERRNSACRGSLPRFAETKVRSIRKIEASASCASPVATLRKNVRSATARALHLPDLSEQQLIKTVFSVRREDASGLLVFGVDPVKPDTQRIGKGCTPGVSGSPAGNAGERYCTTRRGNAHRTEIAEEREVLYRWHPWAGCVVRIEAVEKVGGIVLRCSRDSGASERWLELPAWMFDRATCLATRITPDPAQPWLPKRDRTAEPNKEDSR